MDNGQSAKNFDRADWRKLEEFVKANHKKIDYLVVVKYDRFSRNVSEGLEMMDRLEKKYNIAILSVFEEMYIDPKSPFFFKMRADMLVQAEFELRVIKDRTNFGIRQAKREGRWVSGAPYGYVNKREGTKPVIVPDPEKSIIVKRIFKLFNEGMSMGEVRKEVAEIGYNQKSNSALTRILKNPAYCGLLTLDGEYVKGKHDPIIDMATFNRAQSYFTKESTVKMILNDEVPLRGVLKCTCGRVMTAGKSKGKTAYYWYYKCKSHLEVNLNSKIIHSKMQDVMHELSLSEETIKMTRDKTEKIIKSQLAHRSEKVPDLKRKIQEFENKLASVEEKFIANQITYQVYTSWNNAYNTEINALRSKLTEATEKKANVWDIYESRTKKLTDLGNLYNSSDTLTKHRLINAVFNRDLMYRLNTFVASNLLDVFESKALKLKEKGLLEFSSPSGKIQEITISSGTGSLVELFEILSE